MPQRPKLSPEESRRIVQTLKLVELNDILPLSSSGSPSRADESLGSRFICVLVANARLEHLTLTRTFFSRSEIRAASFKDTDLSDSIANWNDFIDVDFSLADLSRSDLRACVFQRVRFCEANLTGADFRYCGFNDCDFAGADLTDAKLTLKVGKALRLSGEQQSAIDWQADDGEEPEGG